MSTWGPLSRRVADSALFYDAIKDGGPSFAEAAARAARPAADRRVGEDAAADRRPARRRAARRASRRVAAALRELGHEVVERELEYRPRSVAACCRATCAGSPTRPRDAAPRAAVAPHARLPADRRARSRRAAVERAKAAAAADERDARARVRRGRRRRHDARCSPAARRAVGEYEGRSALWTLTGSVRFVPYCGAFNHTGQPAASVPATGFTPTASRSPCSSSRRATASRCCWRSPRSSRRRSAWPDRRPGCAMSPAALREIAEAVAREAGRQLREAFAGPRVNVTAKSSPTDLVSEADHAAERLIRERLAAARPGDGFLGEEGGDERGTQRAALGRRPARRHVNFLFGIPQWAVSIACEDARRARSPASSTTRCATSCGPPSAAARRCSTGGRSGRPTRDDLATAMVATGFGYDAEVRRLQAAVVAAPAPAGARHPAARLGGARPRVDRRRPLRRLLRARPQRAGTSRPASCCAGARGSRCRDLAPAPPAGAGVLVAQHAHHRRAGVTCPDWVGPRS